MDDKALKIEISKNSFTDSFFLTGLTLDQVRANITRPKLCHYSVCATLDKSIIMGNNRSLKYDDYDRLIALTPSRNGKEERLDPAYLLTRNGPPTDCFIPTDMFINENPPIERKIIHVFSSKELAIKTVEVLGWSSDATSIIEIERRSIVGLLDYVYCLGNGLNMTKARKKIMPALDKLFCKRK